MVVSAIAVLNVEGAVCVFSLKLADGLDPGLAVLSVRSSVEVVAARVVSASDKVVETSLLLADVSVVSEVVGSGGTEVNELVCGTDSMVVTSSWLKLDEAKISSVELLLDGTE